MKVNKGFIQPQAVQDKGLLICWNHATDGNNDSLGKVSLIDYTGAGCAHSAIHLPARPVSQTHKFLTSTNLVPRASIWMQKIMITIMAYVFSSLNRASDRMR